MVLRTYIRLQLCAARMRGRLNDELGATAVEYALMLALIFMAIFAAVAFMGQSTSSQFSKVKFP
jgi:Flp pilus assembly pilin Flp